MKTKLIIFVETNGDNCSNNCKYVEGNDCNLFGEELELAKDKQEYIRTHACKVAQTAPWS